MASSYSSTDFLLCYQSAQEDNLQFSTIASQKPLLLKLKSNTIRLSTPLFLLHTEDDCAISICTAFLIFYEYSEQ